MLPAPRVIAIDDNPKHLEGLARGLNQYGAACLQIHFTGDAGGISACPHVRVIFADLHLNESGAANDHTQHFGVIGGLIEGTITPSGPYALILWTRYPDQADALRQFLEERLGREVPRPVTVASIDKMNHLEADGTLKSTEKLMEAVVAIFSGQPQIAALLNWEERVLGAAGDTVSAIVRMAESAVEPSKRPAEVARLLARLAVEAVGEDHVEDDRFHAVNEALLPILADRVSALRSRDGDRDIWDKAFTRADLTAALSQNEAARLNRFLHIAMPAATDTGAVRGSVIPLPDTVSGAKFEETFGIKQDVAAREQFLCSDYADDDARFRWVLLQSQAACDYAQMQPGSLPFYLGLDFDASKVRKGTAPAALWSSPPFVSETGDRFLRINARFQISLSRAVAAAVKPLYRLRDQLLAEILYRTHSYGARPGIISFHEMKEKKEDTAPGAKVPAAGTKPKKAPAAEAAKIVPPPTDKSKGRPEV